MVNTESVLCEPTYKSKCTQPMGEKSNFEVIEIGADG